MAFLLVLLVAVVLVILNRKLSGQKGTNPTGAKRRQKHLERQSPVAKEYPILYVYVAARATALAVGIVTAFSSLRQWAGLSARYSTYQAQLQAQHLTPLPERTTQLIIIASLVIAFAIWLSILLYLVRSKKMKNIRILLSVLLVLDVVGVAIGMAKPNIRLAVGILQAALTAFVLWSLVSEVRIFSHPKSRA